MIKTSKPSFSYITLTFSIICLLLEVFDEFHFHFKWYQSKWTKRTQPLSYPALFNLKSNREELQGNVRKSNIRNCFLIRAILMVKKAQTCEQGEAQLFFFWHLLMNLKNIYYKKCWSGPIKNKIILIFTELYLKKISMIWSTVPEI